MIWDITSLAYEPVEVLAIRLRELVEVVDRHVIVESTETFSGLPREIRWPELQEHPLIAPFARKVDHHVITPRGADPWAKEFHQRRTSVTIADSLGCHPQDVVVFGDLDEIPHRDAVRIGIERAGSGLATRCVGTYRQYAIDLMADGSPHWNWEYHQPLVASRAEIGDDPQAFRDAQPGTESGLIIPLGWHLSSQGSVEDIALKMRSYSHTEYAHITAADIAERVVNRCDIVDRCAVNEVRNVPPSARAPEFDHLRFPAVTAAAVAYLKENT